MLNQDDIKYGRHCVFNLRIHLVFVTKQRRDVFTKAMLDSMQKVFEKVCLDFESELVEFDGKDDYVHLLINYLPKVSIPSLVNSLKVVLNRRLQKEYPEIKNKLIGKRKNLWSPSYFARSCGGAPINIIKQYIEQQRTHKHPTPYIPAMNEGFYGVF